MKCENCVHKEICCFPETANDYDDLGEIVNKCVHFNGWIPVSERFPERDIPVLVFLKNDLNETTMTVAKYQKMNFCNKEFKGWFTTVEPYGENALNEEYVLAWQPLPEPYRL